MEGKRVSAATCVCVLLLLSAVHHDQVAASSEFCRCYRNCIPECRLVHGKPFCRMFCVIPCSVPGGGVGDCGWICLQASLCGAAGRDGATAAAEEAAACVGECSDYWSRYGEN